MTIHCALTYKGARTYTNKDGKENVIHRFIDNEGREGELMVLNPIPEGICEGTKVGCKLIVGERWQDDIKKYKKVQYIKNVVPINN